MTLSDYDCLRVAHILLNLARAYEKHMGMDALHSTIGFSHQDIAGMVIIGQHAPLNARQLSVMLGISPGTTSIYVQKLVEKGLLTKEQDQADRRNWWLRLSPEGEKIYQAFIATTVQFTRDFSAALNDEEQITFFTLLNKAFASVAELIPHVTNNERIL